MPTYWDGYGAELQHNLGVYATGLTVAFGVAEVVGGVVVGVGAGWTGVGLVAAGALIYSGVDDIQAGVRQLAGDEDAVTSKFVLGREAAELAGADEDTARMVGNITDIGLSVGAGVAGGIVRGTQKAAARSVARAAHADKMAAIHQRQFVLANIAESKAARESSNFGTFTKRVEITREAGAARQALATRGAAYQTWKSNAGIAGKPTLKQFRGFMGAHRPTSLGATLYPANTNGFKQMRGALQLHGNSAMSQRTAYLYRLEEKGGRFLKWGVTQDLNARYTQGFMKNKDIIPMASGPRVQMLHQERHLVKTQPGPYNNESWAGAGL